MIRGEIIEEKLPSGFTNFYSKEFPSLPREELQSVAEEVRRRLNSEAT